MSQASRPCGRSAADIADTWAGSLRAGRPFDGRQGGATRAALRPSDADQTASRV